MKEAGTYYILNTITGDRYDGSSVNIRHRWYCHKRLLQKGIHTNPHLQNAWNKYGEDAFSFRRLDIMDGCSASEVRHKEQMLLDYKRATKNLSYNISTSTTSPMTGRPLAEETKQKLSSVNKGRKFSEEHRTKISIAMKGNQRGLGTKRTDETKAKMSAWQKGCTLSAEHRQKLSESHKGKPIPPEQRAKISLALKRHHARKKEIN